MYNLVTGTIDIPQNRPAVPNRDFSKWVAPGAIAEVILFLLSDAPLLSTVRRSRSAGKLEQSVFEVFRLSSAVDWLAT